MKLQFLGATRTVTGSCYFVDNGKVKFLVDCGAFQGPDEQAGYNMHKFPFDPKELDFVFLTHGHFDHCGRLPKLYQEGFRGRIICTPPTRDIMRIVLLDSAKLLSEQLKREGFLKDEQDYPTESYFFDENDVQNVIGLVETHSYGKSVGLTDTLEFMMRDAGHILGSAIFEFWVTKETGQVRKLVFSGDLGQPGQRIIKDPDMIREADYVIVESTYGDRLHRDRNETILELLSILKEAQKTKGNVLIPIFAVERAQEIIYELNLMYEKGLMEKMSVYLDSPMAIKITDVFLKYKDYFDEDAKRLIEKNDDPFYFPELFYVNDHIESQSLANKKGFIVMAGSGMCTGGRIVHHLKNNIDDPNNHIVIVGYQVKGTLGRRLVDGEPEVRIMGQNYVVGAKIHTLGAFSAHADQRDLIYWLRSFGRSPRMVYTVHGMEEVSIGFARMIRYDLNMNSYVPKMGEVVELE